MVRNRYKRIPHPASDTKRERNTNNLEHEDSSFQADGHQAILNKMSKKSKTNRKRTNTDN